MRICFIFMAALAISIANAQDLLNQDLPRFEDVDQNNDSMISETEADLVEGLDFESADTNQDGWISVSEYGYATET